MVAITKLVLLCAASSAAALPLNTFTKVSATASLVTDLGNLDSSVKNLTAQVNKFTTSMVGTVGSLVGGLTSAAVIVTSFTAAHASNRLAYLEATVLTNISSADATTLINTIHTGLSVDNPSAVAAVKAKKAQFTTIGVKPVILAALKQSLSDHVSLSAAIASKIPQDATTQAALKAQVDVSTKAFQDGITYYSS